MAKGTRKARGANTGVRRLAALLAALLLGGGMPVASAIAGPGAAAATAAGDVPGVALPQLDARFWISRLVRPDALLLDPAAVAAQNARLLRQDRSMHDLAALPASLDRAQVAAWITARSPRPTRPLFDAAGAPLAPGFLDGLQQALDLDAIPAQQPARFGLVVRRAALRSFPTALRAFAADGDHDLDRFQESALFPGTPVAVVHRSRDQRWLFVVARNYAAWTEAGNVAEGPREVVLGYAAREPALTITGATERTAYTPEQPQVSQLQLDMGARVPLARSAGGGPVNGQHPYASWTIELPVRDGDGRLALVPALLPRVADSAPQPLPLTRTNLLRQAFKFLGERYGWGHDYNGRDCSGFVAEVFASFGVLLPRNTGDQAASPALAHRGFGAGDTLRRRAAAEALQPGDLVYVPGHVLLVIGRLHGMPYVIHDIHEGRTAGSDGRPRSLHLNAVSVTPLPPLLLEDGQRMVDRISSIVRIGGQPLPEPSR